MRIFEHLQSYGVVSAACARLSSAVETAKSSNNRVVQFTVATAESYLVPPIQRAVTHVTETYPTAVATLDDYSCLALERTETLVSNSAQRLVAAKRAISETPEQAITKAFELTEMLIDRILPPIPELSQEEENERVMASLVSEGTITLSVTPTSHLVDRDESALPHAQRAQALAATISHRLRTRAATLPTPIELIRFAQTRSKQLDHCISLLDSLSSRIHEFAAEIPSHFVHTRDSATLYVANLAHVAYQRTQPIQDYLEDLCDQHPLLASSIDHIHSVLVAASKSIKDFISRAHTFSSSSHLLHEARLSFGEKFSHARNSIVSNLDKMSDKIPATFSPLFQHFLSAVSYVLTVPEGYLLTADQPKKPEVELHFAGQTEDSSASDSESDVDTNTPSD